MVHRLIYLIKRLFDLVLPRHPEVLQIAHETPKTFLRFFLPQQHDDITFVSHYGQSSIKCAIHAVKFYHDHHATQLLAHLLDQYLNKLPKNIILVPLPLSAQRQRARGHNQIETILSCCTSPLAHSFQPLLKRTRNTQPQSHLSRTERLKNVNQCFSISSNKPIHPDIELVVIDDVMTTGATLKAAISCLKQAYPKTRVSGLALAH